MTEKLKNISAIIKQEYPRDIENISIKHDELTINVNSESIIKVMQFLKDNESLSFEVLIDLCGVDYSTYGATEWQTTDSTMTGFSRGVEITSSKFSHDFKSRFAVVYHLLSIKHNQRIRVKTFLNDDTGIPMIDSVINIWNDADWFEREAFDLFGIIFKGHPDLRRILTDYGFVGHPFRKDFPLIGHVEVAYDNKAGKVVYQPVSIEPRVLVPRVIRNDDRYDDIEIKQD